MAEPRLPETPAQVYNALGQAYEEVFGEQPGAGAAIAHLLSLLPGKARVLDVGSGTGRPVAATIAAAGHDVTGYDVSEKMVELARERVPAARFELADMRELDFEPGSWDVVVAFFSMLQLPRADQEAMIGRFATWLAPGGHLVLATVPSDANGRAGEWMGHWMQTFSYPVPVLRQLLANAGLRIVREHVEDFTPDSEQADAEAQVYLTVRKTA